MKTYCGIRGTDPLLPNLGIRQKLVVNIGTWPF